MKKIRIYISYILMISIVMSATIFTKEINSAQAASNIYMSDKTLALELGHYKTLRVYGTSRTASWSSSNSWVASVSSKGKVTAKAAGTATITATVAGKRLTSKVTVIRINKKALTLTPGKTSTLMITGTKSDVIWHSSNKAIATVSGTGIVTSIAPGTATITASVDGKEITSKVSVIAMNHKSIVLEKGHWYGFIKTLKVEGAASNIIWSSNNKPVATVSSLGKVLAKGAGTATITALVDGVKLTTKVRILTISEKEFTQKIGKTKRLTIDGTTSTINWHSNNTSVATVSNDGTVTSKELGSALITANVNGKKVKSRITVVK